MATEVLFTPLNEITNEKTDAKIRVRVHMLWKQSYKKTPHQTASIDMILMDPFGNKIQATLRNWLFPDFENTLKEGGYFIISNFAVEKYDGDWRLIDHKWKINLQRNSKVRRCPEFEGVSDGLNLVSYQDINALTLSLIFGFDVVGLLVEIDPLVEHKENGIITKSTKFALQDNQGNRITCNVWANHAVQMQEYIAANKLSTEPVIVFIQNARLKNWRGNPQVANHLFGCRIQMNTDAKPICDFKACLQQNCALDPMEFSPTQFSNKVTQTVAETLIKLFDAPTVKTVEQIRDTTKVSECFLKATVLRVIPDEGWFTYSCNVCHQKAKRRFQIDTSETIFECVTCGEVTDVGGKVRAVIRVQDMTGSLSLVLFDYQLAKLINRSSSWLKNKIVKQISDPHSIPHEFDCLVNKEIVFKVHVGTINVDKGYPGYTVQRGTEDPDVITLITNKLNGVIRSEHVDDLVDITPSPTDVGYKSDNGPSPVNLKDISPVPFSLKRNSESPPDLEASSSNPIKPVKEMEPIKFPRLE